MLKRVASLLMCLLFVASSLLLVACNNDGDDTSGGNTSGTTAGFLNEAKNWGGEVVNILGYNGEYTYHSIQIDCEEKTDEPVTAAFYNRNALIEEQYGIDIEVVVPESGSDPIQMLRNDMTSGLNEYQAAVIPIVYMAPLAIDGLLKDFRSIDNGYLHLDQAWWDQTIMEDLEMNNKVFFLAGDALVEDDEATWAIYFNKDLLSTYGIEENPYDLVREGKWTLDKMYELAQKVSKTTGGSSKHYNTGLEVGGDQWGIVAQSYDFYLFMQGGEQTVIDNSGETPVLRILEEENVNTFNTITEFFYDAVNCGVADYMGSWTTGVYEQERKVFAIGNALFMPGSIAVVGQQVMRDAEIHYGILPMPKRNELQENYSTSVTVYHCAVIAVPFTNTDKLDVTSYALEAMAFYGKEMVTPEYYDRTLTLKRFEDNDSADMLDLIFRNRTYDMGAVFNFGDAGNGAGTLYFYTDLLGTKSTGITSHFESKQNLYESGIEEFVATCYN